MSRWRLKLRTERRKRLGRKSLAAIVVAALALSAALYLYKHGGEEKYMLQSLAELQEKINTGHSVAIMFVSPTCHVCEKMIPYWVRLAERGSGLGVEFYILPLNERTAEAFTKYGVTSTPTYILFVDGKQASVYVGEFRGENITQAMLEWIQGSLLQPSLNAPSENYTCTGAACPVNIEAENNGGNGVIAIMFVTALIAGILASLSPCTLPLLIAHASTSTRVGGRKARAAAGCFTASLTAIMVLGVLFAAFSWSVSLFSEILTPILAALLLLLGVAGLAGYSLELPPTLSAGRLGLYGSCGLFGFLSVQCNLPLVLGPFLMMIGIGVKDPLSTITLALGYAVGLSTVLASVLLGSSRVSAFLNSLLGKSTLLDRLSGAVITMSGLVIAAYYLNILV